MKHAPLCLLMLGTVAGCGPSNACAQNVATDCTPLYEPTFDNLYTNTLHPTCALPGGSCHATEGHMGGLSFDDANTAYALLLGAAGGVMPGNAACSLVVERVLSTDPRRSMPPGKSLSVAEQCVFVRWAQQGARR